jgi:hypothetical protein
MPGVFVSHAAADSAFVNEFVDTVLRLGCDLGPDALFYTSGADTGVPSGTDLLAHVRNSVSGANLVVAILTPVYQTRPVCIAELGAAWAKTDNLFPLLAPGMPRSDLDGVLVGMTVRTMDDSAVLDELADRVALAVGRRPKAATWGQYKEKWLANAQRLAKKLDNVRPLASEDFDRLEADVAGARAALALSEEERAELAAQLDELAKTRPADVVRRIRMPKGETERFTALRIEAKEKLGQLDKIVQDAMFYHAAGRSMPWPDAFEERIKSDWAREAVDDGYLKESDGLLEPDEEFHEIAESVEAVRALDDFLERATPAFVEWFRAEYGKSPDLSKRAVWDVVLS